MDAVPETYTQMAWIKKWTSSVDDTEKNTDQQKINLNVSTVHIIRTYVINQRIVLYATHRWTRFRRFVSPTPSHPP